MPARLTLAALLLATAGCAGYQVGPQGLYPPHVQTVHVPVFESESYRRGLAELLTEAVVKEIERRTPYKVVGPQAADTVLHGRILREGKSVLGENMYDEPRELEYRLQVEMTWVDAAGNAVAPGVVVPVAPLAAQISETSTFVPEAGQSVSTAQLEAVRDMARQIVNQMQAAW
jgi:hypothetical protein